MTRSPATRWTVPFGSPVRRTSYDSVSTESVGPRARSSATGSNQTMMLVTSRKSRSGFAYAEPERTRLFIDLAVADARGSRQQVIHARNQELHRHNGTRPVAPQPPGPPPVPPPADATRDHPEPVSHR